MVDMDGLSLTDTRNAPFTATAASHGYSLAHLAELLIVGGETLSCFMGTH